MGKSKRIFHKRILFICLLILPFIKSVYAQNEVEQGVYKVNRIYAIGNNHYPEDFIRDKCGLKNKEGGGLIEIPSDETRDAIERLWKLQIFSNVQLLFRKITANDIDLIFRVEEFPQLDTLIIEGNSEFSYKDLNDKLQLTPGKVITKQMISDMAYNIKRYYADENYPFTSVIIDTSKRSGGGRHDLNLLRISIYITEGEKVGVTDISFNGNKHVTSKELKNAMAETTEETWWKFWDKAWFNKDKYEDDKKLILDHYKELGYKDAVIDKDAVGFNSDTTGIDINIKVIEGRRFRIRDINFTGNRKYADSILVSRLGFKKGDIYNMTKFRQNLTGNESLTDVASLYYDSAYCNLVMDPEEIPVNDSTVDIEVRITENKKCRFGFISFTGNTKTQDKVVRRELFTLPGDYFSRVDILRSRDRINSLNYFNPEKLSFYTNNRNNNDSTVDLVYTLEEKSSDQLNASIGWTQSYGLSGSLGLVFNNFDIAAPFDGGAGQILSLTWDFGSGGTYQTFSLGFTEPWLYSTPTSVGVNVFDSKQNYTYSLRETGGEASVGRRFKFPDDYFRGDWFLKIQRTEVLYGAGIYQEGRRDQISIGQTISRSSTDNPIFPSMGSKVSFGLELAGLNVLGSVNFHKETFSAEAYNRIDNAGKLVFYSNMLFESINSIAKDGYIPPTEYLFMGGNGLAYNTIALRGYDDRTVGPSKGLNNPIGGTVLIKYGVELRYFVIQDPIPLYVSIFGEAGNVWSSFHKADFFDLKRSVGFGARVVMPPIGIIGFDLGYGFDRKLVDGNDPAWLFHFQFGKSF